MKRLLSTVTLVFSAAMCAIAGPTDASPLAPPALANECAYPAGWAPPFTHVYNLRNGATVVFIATEHTRDPADATHRQIREAFDRYHPGYVLAEGIASSKSSNDKYRKFLIDQATRDLQIGSIQETLFAIKLASDRGTAFSGWDFSPDELYAGGLADHLMMDDMLGAHLVRAKVDPADTVGGIRAVTRETGYAARVQPLGPFDYAGWYRKNYGAAFDASHASPCGGGIAGQVAKDETRRRNLNLVNLIDRYATPGVVVLVEAGANHWLALRGYLQSSSKSWT